MSEESKPYILIFDGSLRSDILTYTVSNGIKKSGNYHFKVTANNYVGVSQFSPVLNVFAAVVPSIALNFTITDSNLGSVSL